MTDQQPNALRLADRLTSPNAGPWDNADAAAELRCLHEYTQWQDRRISRLRAVADHRNALLGEQMARADALETANAELLEALKWIAHRCPAGLIEHVIHPVHREAAHDAGACARAAIAKAAGGSHD